jgi:carboxypeptidase PM20D1
MPPRETAVTVLAEALTRLRDRPFPARLVGPTEEMFETLAPELGFGARILFANRWLTGPLVRRFLAAEPTTAAMLRTTIAPTMLEASEKDNVLPIEASAHVNFRIHPDDSIESVVEHVREVVDGLDIDVSVADGFGSEPSPISPTDSEAYRLLARTVREVFPEAVVAPFLVMGGTDARHMTGLTPNVFRFIPIEIEAEMIEGIHGTGERVGEEALVDAVRFYRRLVENASSAELQDG